MISHRKKVKWMMSVSIVILLDIAIWALFQSGWVFSMLAIGCFLCIGLVIGIGYNYFNHRNMRLIMDDEYRYLFDQVPCIITVQDRNFKIRTFNREFANRFETTPGEYCYRAYKGRNEKCDNCPLDKTFQDGKAHYSEEKGQNKDGTPTYWVVKTSPVHNSKGQIIAAVEMSLDITRSKMLEMELQKSEKKYCAIFNNVPNPIFVLNKNTLDIIACNSRTTKIYGFDTDELVGKSFLELFKEDDLEQYKNLLRTNSVLNKVEHIKKDGGAIFVDIRISPSEFPENEVLLVTTSDITKRIETEQQLTQASKMATLGEMATGVAHELNQPLTVMKTASNFFMRKIRKNEPIPQDILQEMCQKIDYNVDRATKIINHMRQFARKSDQTLEPVKVNMIMEKAIDIFSQQLKIRGIELVWDIEKNLPPIIADSGRMEQVLINLLINARDAIEEKSKQEGDKIFEKRIILFTKLIENKVVIKVCDTGIGVPKAISDKIFEPFFTTKEVGKGTGLGLSISYGIIKDFGGDIKMESHESGGACFIISLPISMSVSEQESNIESNPLQ